MPRLSDICYLDGCSKPHYRKAAFEDMSGHRYHFCCDEHLQRFIDGTVRERNINIVRKPRRKEE